MEKICEVNGISMKKEIDEFGNIFYYNENNKLHREDGPAIEYVDGDKWWYKNGKLHKEDGPAVEYSDGDKGWYKNGLQHKEDGPAVEYSDGNKEYWYNDIWHPEIETDEEWIRFVKLMVFQ